MKVSTTPYQNAFQPFLLAINVDSQNEAEALFALFDHEATRKCVPTVDCMAIRNAVLQASKATLASDRFTDALNRIRH